MKKRIFSIFLTLALLCSMLPQFSLPVNAENAEDDVEGHDSACSCSECCCESECDDSAKCFEDYIQGQLKCEAMSDNCPSNTPLINTATSSSDITAQLTTLKNTYKAGSYWNHKSGSSYDGYSVSNTPCGTNNYECNQLYGGSQCWAFARHLAKILFGSYPPEASAFSDGYTTNTGWKLIRNPSNVTLEPGDYIRADGHSAIVWYLDGNKVYVAQCWGGSGCKLDWGAFWGSSKCTTVSDIVSTNFVGVWKHPGSNTNSEVVYPSYLTVQTKNSTQIKSEPKSSSEDVVTLPTGAFFTVTAVYKNEWDYYWYKGVTADGQEGYMYPSNADVTEFLYDDVIISNPRFPQELTVSSGFYIEGVVSSTYNRIHTLGGFIYPSGVSSGNSYVYGSTVAVDAKSYNLYKSAIDTEMKYSKLNAGSYNSVITANVVNYYSSDGTTLLSQSKNFFN